MTFRWAFLKLRSWLKNNCKDVELYRLGDLRYCLHKYFEVTKRKRAHGKSGLALVAEYNDKTAPIYKGIKTPKATLKRATKKEKKEKYKSYIVSMKWKIFKRGIVKTRGNVCERCGTKTNKLDLHHKTYARLFNELPQDVMLLCRDCHNEIHE